MDSFFHRLYISSDKIPRVLLFLICGLVTDLRQKATPSSSQFSASIFVILGEEMVCSSLLVSFFSLT